MKIKTILVALILLVAVISGCVDSRVNGLYVSDKDHVSTLKFLDDGTVLAVGKSNNGDNNSAVENYKIDGNTVILTWFGMAYVLKIQDGGKTLVADDGTKYTKVNS